MPPRYIGAPSFPGSLQAGTPYQRSARTKIPATVHPASPSPSHRMLTAETATSRPRAAEQSHAVL